MADIFTVGSSIFTANSASQYLIAGQTLAPGSAIVISGTTVSLNAAATGVAVGSSTEVVSQSTTMASVVVVGSGGGGGNRSVAFTGGAEGRGIQWGEVGLIVGILGGMVVC